jgi:hypothetical protein
MMRSEHLAVWYLRLNGIFTIPNFILHPDRPGSARTDADVAGVRFPHRREFNDADVDQEWFARRTTVTAVITEVKNGTCAINGPWSRCEAGNVERILGDLGWYDPDEARTAATMLYQHGWYDAPALSCSLFCIGNDEASDVRERFPGVPQHTWSHIAHWIYQRFDRYHDVKTDHSQWDDVGQLLWDTFLTHRDAGTFDAALRDRFHLPQLRA